MREYKSFLSTTEPGIPEFDISKIEETLSPDLDPDMRQVEVMKRLVYRKN